MSRHFGVQNPLKSSPHESPGFKTIYQLEQTSGYTTFIHFQKKIQGTTEKMLCECSKIYWKKDSYRFCRHFVGT